MLISFSIIFISLAITFYFYLKYKHSYWSRRGVYSPPCHWLFGHFKEFFFLRKSPPEVLEELHNGVDENVPLVGFYIFHKAFLLVRDPEAVKHVLVKDFPVFCNRGFAYKQKSDIVTTKNIFSEHQPEWKHLRTKMSPMFTSGKQKKLFLLMLECAENLKNYLESKIKSKTSVEVREISMKYTIDVISSLSFGIQINSFVEPKSEFFARRKLNI